MGGGGKGGGGSSETTTINTDPWAGQQPYLSGLYGQAAGLGQQQPYPYPGVVPFSPATLGSQVMQTGRALAGSPVQRSGQAENLRTTSGQYLHGGPGFDAAYGAAANRIIPQVAGGFEQAGRYGSGLHSYEAGRGLGDAFAGLYGGERDRMLRASLASPAMAQADYADIGALGQVGAQQEGRAQQALSDAQARWGFQQQAPYGQLQTQSGVIQAMQPGGQSEQESPLYRNPLGGALGGAAAGSVIGPAISGGAIGGPWGAAAGAGLGLMSAMK